ncbi:MAG TPA: carboxypeptidase-like regulatory domain-containing protein, partial [Solirubrobacteraceae bacterium]|nr:carboxypeptidase-like regulatory domain-containing protein [Solirubrobacteraceae bacterium]
ADQRLRSQADGLATQDQERLRGLSDQQLESLAQSRPSTVDGTTFTVQSVATYLDTTGQTSCTSTAAAYFKIASTVTWSEGFNSTPASINEESILSRPVTGDLLTQVTDQTGAALSGVTIAPTGPSTQTALTDSKGCVMFAGLTPGLYTVNISYPGYVDPNGNGTPSGTATVTTTGTAQPNNGAFRLGQAGSIAGTFKTAYPTATPLNGQADGISWLGNLGSISMSGGYQYAPTSDPSTPGTGYTAASLFPFASASTPVSYTGNYSVWAGRCAGQAPPAGTDQFTVSPGSLNVAQTIREPLLNLNTVYYKSSSGATAVVVPPAHVSLSFNSGGCSDQWYPTLASTMSTTYGWFQYPGQAYAPSGTLTVCADYKVGSTYYENSVTTGNTSFTGVNSVPTVTITKGSTTSGRC